MINWIADGILVVILILSVVFGAKRGFIKSAVRLIGTLIAVILAFYISTPIAEGIFDHTMKGGIEQTVQQQLTGSAAAPGAPLEEQLSRMIEGLPEWTQNAITAYVGSPKEISQKVAERGAQTGEAVSGIVVQYAVRPIAVFLLQLGVFLLLFILLSIVVRLLGGFLDTVFKLPVIKQVNGLFGGILGLLRGVLIVMVLVAVLHAVIVASGDGGVIPKTVLTDTKLVSFAANHDPLLHPHVITEVMAYWKK